MTEKRARLVLLILCLIVLGGSALVYRLVFQNAATAPSAARPVVMPVPAATVSPVAVEHAFAVTEVSGIVEVRHDGTWRPLAEGERVLPTDAIRTGSSGRTVLRTAAGDSLLLRERVELEVDTLSTTVTELTLTKGKVNAAAAPGTERFQITSSGARAVGKGGGRFIVYPDTRGAVTVASETGDVQVVSQGSQVTVGERQQTYVSPGEAPKDPVPIPDAVFLSIAWPPGEIHATKTTLRGKTRPGTLVEINGQPVVVGDDGSFETQVALKDGKNSVEIVGEAIDGTTREAMGRIQAHTQGPPLEADPSSLWGATPKKKVPPRNEVEKP
jgi:hypothetical protein